MQNRNASTQVKCRLCVNGVQLGPLALERRNRRMDYTLHWRVFQVL